MAIRKIIGLDDDRLRKKSKPVDKIDGRLMTLIQDMRDTLREANGLGLAAVQVGVLKRVAIIVDEVENEEPNAIVIINPEMIEVEGEQCESEGCLSMPGKFAYVKRPYAVKVRAMNEYGQWMEYDAEGNTARVFSHEMDHMDGVMFGDKAERFLTDEEIEALRDGGSSGGDDA